MHRPAWTLGLDFLFRFWAVFECPQSSQLMPKSPFFIPCTVSRRKSFPMGTEGIIFCLLVLKIKAHSQVSKIISSRKNPDDRLTYLCGVLYNPEDLRSILLHTFSLGSSLFQGDAQAGYKETDHRTGLCDALSSCLQP